MSRGQEGDVVHSAGVQNQDFFNNAQNSYTKAQGDVGNYEKQLGDYASQVAKFQSGNPYVEGGEFQRSQNQDLANTADAQARAAGQALQSQALRTGGNTAGAIAAEKDIARQNTRDLMAKEAQANQGRIGAEAGYNAQGVGMEGDVTKASEFPVQAETTLAGQQGGLSQQALATRANAAKTPSWMDQFGGAFAQSLGKTLGGGNAKG